MTENLNTPAGASPSTGEPSTSSVSRRAALFGAVALAAGPAAATPAASVALTSLARHSTSGAADSRLAQLADVYEVLDHEVDATHSTRPGYTDLIDRYGPIEDELAETPADTMVGVMAKARVMQFASCRECAGAELGNSIADDLVRLLGGHVDG